jgi:hypothetical protein
LVVQNETWRSVVVDLLRENEELREVAERYHEENACLHAESSDLYE